MTAGFPPTSITYPELAIWWSSCQFCSCPHSSNTPFFISVGLFSLHTFQESRCWGTIPAKHRYDSSPERCTLPSLQDYLMTHFLVLNHGSQENIWAIVYNNPLAVCLYGCFSTLWRLDSLQHFLLRQIISW